MTSAENRRLDKIEKTLDSHSDTLHDMAVNVATILERIKTVPTWPQIEQAVERDATQRIQLAIATCQNKNHSKGSERSGTIRVDLCNGKSLLKYLIYAIISMGASAGGYVVGDTQTQTQTQTQEKGE